MLHIQVEVLVEISANSSERSGQLRSKYSVLAVLEALKCAADYLGACAGVNELCKRSNSAMHTPVWPFGWQMHICDNPIGACLDQPHQA